MDAPEGLEETVEALRLFPRERVQQRTTEQTEDVPQFAEETVELVMCGPTRTRAEDRQANGGGVSGMG